MTWSGLRLCSLCLLCLLLPLPALADSALAPASGAAAAAAGGRAAGAHVDFKIVIPGVLSMEIPARHEPLQTGRVVIGTNSHNVALGCTGPGGARRDRFFAAAPRGTVGEEETVLLPDTQRAARVICTAAMP